MSCWNYIVYLSDNIDIIVDEKVHKQIVSCFKNNKTKHLITVENQVNGRIVEYTFNVDRILCMQKIKSTK